MSNNKQNIKSDSIHVHACVLIEKQNGPCFVYLGGLGKLPCRSETIQGLAYGVSLNECQLNGKVYLCLSYVQKMGIHFLEANSLLGMWCDIHFFQMLLIIYL